MILAVYSSDEFADVEAEAVGVAQAEGTAEHVGALWDGLGRVRDAMGRLGHGPGHGARRG